MPAGLGSVALFVAIFCLILTMYGGGFATIPAYLADIFGTQFVGAIHGRLLTAWSTAGVAGTGSGQLHPGIPDRPGVSRAAQAYNTTMYVLAGLLVIGFLCNLAVRPVADRYFMTDEELDGRARSGPSEGPDRPEECLCTR